MHVEFVLGACRAHAAREVRVQGAYEIGATAAVVRDDLAHGPVDEAVDVPAVREKQPEEAQVLGGRALAGAVQEPERVEAAAGLLVRDGYLVRVVEGRAYGGGGADGDRLAQGAAEVAGGLAGQLGGALAGAERQQQDRAAVAGGGESVPGGGEVRGGRPEAPPVGALPASGVGVGRAARPVDAGGEHDVGCVAVGTEPGGALAQQTAVAVGGVEEVVEEFAPYALFGLARRAAGEQQQGRDERGPLQGPLVDGVEVGLARGARGRRGSRLRRRRRPPSRRPRGRRGPRRGGPIRRPPR